MSNQPALSGAPVSASSGAALNASRVFPLIKPVYDAGAFGQDVILPLWDLKNASSNSSSITLSTINAQGYATPTRISGGSSTTFAPLDENLITSFIAGAANFTLPSIHAGVNTDYTQTFEWLPDMNAFVYKMQLWILCYINCSAFTSGTINFNTITVTVTVDEDGTNQRTLYSQVFTPGLTAISAANKCNLFLISDTAFPALQGDRKLGKVKGGQPVHIKVVQSNSNTGTLTYTNGLALLWTPVPTQASGVLDFPGYPSQVGFHVHASGDHADPVLKDPDMFGRYDFAGTPAGVF